MGGRRRLKAGAPRLLGRHDGPRGRAYRRCFDALAAEFALDRPLAQLEAGRVALAWALLQAATESLETARTTREQGQGRRPSAREIRSLEKRVGLADGTYSAALDKLRELAAEHRRSGAPGSPEAVLDQLARREGHP